VARIRRGRGFWRTAVDSDGRDDIMDSRALVEVRSSVGLVRLVVEIDEEGIFFVIDFGRSLDLEVTDEDVEDGFIILVGRGTVFV